MSHSVVMERIFQSLAAFARACERKEIGSKLEGNRITGRLRGTLVNNADGTFQLRMDADYRRTFQLLESLYDIEIAKMEAEAQQQPYEEFTTPEGGIRLEILVSY